MTRIPARVRSWEQIHDILPLHDLALNVPSQVARDFEAILYSLFLLECRASFCLLGVIFGASFGWFLAMMEMPNDPAEVMAYVCIALLYACMVVSTLRKLDMPYRLIRSLEHRKLKQLRMLFEYHPQLRRTFRRMCRMDRRFRHFRKEAFSSG